MKQFYAWRIYETKNELHVFNSAADQSNFVKEHEYTSGKESGRVAEYGISHRMYDKVLYHY